MEGLAQKVHLYRELYFYLDGKWLGPGWWNFQRWGLQPASSHQGDSCGLQDHWSQSINQLPWVRGWDALAPLSLSSEEGPEDTLASASAAYRPPLTCSQPGRGIHLPLAGGEPLPALGPCCCSHEDRWHRLGGPQGALGGLARILPGALLKDLDHRILLQDLGMEHL